MKKCKITYHKTLFAEHVVEFFTCECDACTKAQAEVAEFKKLQEDQTITERERNIRTIEVLLERFGGKKND